MEFNVKVIDNFLSPEQCHKIVSFLETIGEWERHQDSGSWWDNRSLSDYNIYNNFNKEIGQELVDIKQMIAEVIKSHYDVKNIYPDLLSISRWFPGMEQPPHADDMTNVLDDQNNSHIHRDFGSVIYLNNNYSGGETYYPNHNVSVSPIPGTLVIHPATPEYLHGVSKTEGAIRYTISSFWTTDIKFFNNWLPN